MSWIVTDDGELPCGCGQRVEHDWAPGTAKRFARPVLRRKNERPEPAPPRGGSPKGLWSAQQRAFNRL